MRFDQLVTNRTSHSGHSFPMKKTLVIGLGNPIMGDDGIGPWLVDNLKDDFPDFTFEKMVTAGWELLDVCGEYERVVILDAMKTGEPVGTVRKFSDIKDAATLHLAASHGIDLFTNIRLGRTLYPQFPSEVLIYGIEVDNPKDFSDKFSEAVYKKLATIIEAVKEALVSL